MPKLCRWGNPPRGAPATSHRRVRRRAGRRLFVYQVDESGSIIITAYAYAQASQAADTT
jgi:hypothetical protein